MSAAASSAEQQQQQQINTDQILEVVRKAIEAERARIQPIQNLRTERDRTKARYVETCPAGLQPCDPDEENKNGRTCPDADLYAPNPLIVDVKGRICYAPADLSKYAGGDVNGQQIEVLTEMFAGRLLQLIQKDAATEKIIKAALLNDGITSTLGSGNYNASLCSTPSANDDACDKWNLAVVENLDENDLKTGLQYAIRCKKGGDVSIAEVTNADDDSFTLQTHIPGTLTIGSYSAGLAQVLGSALGTNNIANQDCVFTAYTNAFQSGDVKEVAPYDKYVNPATLAFAGAFAWAIRADKILEVTHEQPIYVKRVVTLAQKIRDINALVLGRTERSSFVEYANVLRNLTFDIAWPIILSGQVTATDIFTATRAIIDKKLNDVTPAQFKALTPAQQWKAIVDQHLKTVKV